MSAARGHIVLAAGGTGGHMFPAHALSLELQARGFGVGLVTDARGLDYPGLFPGIEPQVIAAESPSRGGWLGPVKTYWALRRGRRAARRLFKAHWPRAVVGFGGYAALPAILAALSLRLPVAVHEQNAVLGRVNRLLANRVAAIAVAYADTRYLRPKWRAKTVLTGNPVRPEIVALREAPYPRLGRDGVLRLLIIGGSQGARVLSTVVPQAVKLLPPGMVRRLQIVQQCRSEDIERVRAVYRELNIPAEITTFIEDMPAQLRIAHLVIGRAGASTLAELAVAGRPAILVPLPSAMDDHQTANAEALVAARGAICMREADFTPIALAKQLQRLAVQPEELAQMAAGAYRVGQPKAAHILADLVEHIIASPSRRRAA
ncbi:MAG: undecaprenyldiphospho-muramoylpentapeptide beta-N-acetylglucosaminyltransferase [Alphaproteobacteria bacterium]|nr:MAG: undecaprenyldiphospho-muramoylpentapeptide beta-N-acetylglucosaminyltransferase [Alphaproteobacteria bacterium]